MSIIKCSELAYVRMRLPDLNAAEQFLTDFGLQMVRRQGNSLYLRPTDPVHHCYIVEHGPTRMLGFGFFAKSLADLDTLAAHSGMPVQETNEPGGGFRVRLSEPGGYQVDVIYGMTPVEPIPVMRQPVNTGSQPHLRAGALLRLPKGRPTPVKRIAHVVLGTQQLLVAEKWFIDTLGLISSDRIFATADGPQVGTFLRVDKGEEYVDHHSLFLIASTRIGLQHVSFESQDIDAVMADHHYLKGLHRYDHIWGIGRHLLGSQLFDYWRDPFGYLHEHWADSDRLNAAVPTGVWEAKDGFVTQWGEPSSELFRASTQP